MTYEAGLATSGSKANTDPQRRSKSSQTKSVFTVTSVSVHGTMCSGPPASCSCVLAPSVMAAGNQQCLMILTSAGQLPCKNIIHIVVASDPAKIKEAVCSVLKLCEENKFTSVAFPALGTGLCRQPQYCSEEPDYQSNVPVLKS